MSSPAAMISPAPQALDDAPHAVLVEAPQPPPEDGRTRFELYRDALIHDWMKILSVLGVCLIPMFLILDDFTMPKDLLRRFAWYRGIPTALVLGQLLWLRASRPSRWSFLHGYLFSGIVSAMIVRMTVDLGGFVSGYYVGLMLVIFPVNVLLPWRAVHSAVNGLLTVGLYVLANLAWGAPSPNASVINNLYFLISTVVIVVAISHTRYVLVEREFKLRAELEDSNRDLERSRADLKAARDALWGEMEIAKRIQTALLPRNRRMGHYEAVAAMHPADEIGGDYYDFIDPKNGEHWLAVGDVSGHGVESGLVMMMAQTSIATLIEDRSSRSPSEVFVAANRVLRENVSRMDVSRYMTVNLIRLLPDRLLLAGKHQDLLLWRAQEDRVEVVETDGSWLGVVDDARGSVQDQSIPVKPGDWILLFTDGITEALSPTGELFGQERLATLLGRLAGKVSLDAALASILAEVRAFRQTQDDDVTVVLLQRDAA